MERPFPAYRGDEPYLFVSYAHDDAALVYQEEAIAAKQAPAPGIRANIAMYYHESIVRALDDYEDYRAALTRIGIDNAWRDELLQMVRENAPITGIDVHPADLARELAE